MEKTSIHSTAIVNPKASLADGVEIGPYAIIEANVAIGKNTRIQAHSVITGHTVIGDDNLIGYGSIIGAPPQDLGYDGKDPARLKIGNRNTIREYVTIHAGPGNDDVITHVGDENFLMTGTHLGHNARITDNIIIANNCLLAGFVEVGERAFLGGGSVFHQFMRVGALTMVKGNSRTAKDIPPFLISKGENHVVGLNTVGLRRSGYTDADRRDIKNAFRLLYKSGLNVSQALEKAEEMEWGPHGLRFFEFVRTATKRGICSLAD